VRRSGGWRGWREGMGDFPDITVSQSGVGDRVTWRREKLEAKAAAWL
jgi:hypothetical protein